MINDRRKLINGPSHEIAVGTSVERAKDVASELDVMCNVFHLDNKERGIRERCTQLAGELPARRRDEDDVLVPLGHLDVNELEGRSETFRKATAHVDREWEGDYDTSPRLTSPKVHHGPHHRPHGR